MMDFLLRKFKKSVRSSYRDVKSLILRKELLKQDLPASISSNYNIASSMFAGIFGHITYQSPEMMICYKQITEPITKDEYIKLLRSFREYGFNLYVKCVDCVWYVGLMPCENIQRFYSERAVGDDGFNPESLLYLMN